jgi:betaine-aldehyde dehydrogenase
VSSIIAHWIDGRWDSGGEIETSQNPSDGEVLGMFASGGEREALMAVAAARAAFDTGAWPNDRDLRFRAICELAERIEERRDAMIRMLSLENGKIIPEAGFEVDSMARALRYYAGLVLSDAGAATEAQPGVFYQSTREPIGVAGIIVPWNAPLALLVRSLAPALAAGCTVVIKVPGQTALTTELFSQAVAATTSLPAGVVNIFTESGNSGSPALVTSPDVDIISYTGSTKVGRVIAAVGAKTLKRMNLELGGKTPMIVFDDADLDVVAPLLVKALTTFSGQFCMAGTRVLAERGIADELRNRLIELIGQVRVGPSIDPASQMGPVIDRQSVERIDGFVNEAAKYAKVLVRGGPITDGPLAKGSFYRPSLLEVEDLTVPLVQQEVFGPVLSFEIFQDERDVIARANATEFGLAAAIFTNDVSRSFRVSRAIKAGTVWTNTWASINDRFEEGGFKQSGIGRLRGTRGMEEFQEIKTCVHVTAVA